jgi:hypothetical protein
MRANITWTTTIVMLVGLAAIATSGLHSDASSRRHVNRGPAADVVDCSIHDPLSPCYAGNLGYPAGDLFVAYY